ncbi:putative replication protein DnaC [Shigella flexneri K-315]|uniref:Putative replication protein DnaC n=1 Tax=Shigella flexneri K-315 TaxID=766150 RepID=I6CM81_SHIFL|nr:putative replication protein DnaC [Shigella flexneri K-315]
MEITDVMRLTRAVKNCWRNDSEKQRMKLLSVMRQWIC